MPESPTYYQTMQPVPDRRQFSPVRAAGWLTLAATVAGILLSGYFLVRWLDANIFSLGIQDAGQVQVDEAALVESIRSFEMVTVKNTYDTNSHTEFKKRLNAGLWRVSLPGWIAGQTLDVEAQVTVAAGVDLGQVHPADIEVIERNGASVVVVRIPEAEITSVEIAPGSFDISTSSGLLTRVQRRIGVDDRDVRDDALVGVSAEAQQQALDDGIIDAATQEARLRLQSFLQSMSQAAGEEVVYLVEVQSSPPR